MQIAQDLAGYQPRPRPTCCAAPWARRSRRKWRRSATRFVAGAVERGTEKAHAETIFECLRQVCRLRLQQDRIRRLMRFITYQTAYMKANHPVEFLAASMTLDMGNTDKLAEFRDRGARLGIAVEPPSINRSGRRFRRRRQCHPLCARGTEGRRPRRGRGDRRGARRAPVRRPRRLRAARQSARASTSGCWKASPPPALSMSWSATGRAPSRRRRACSRPRSAPTMPRRAARASCSAARPRRNRSTFPTCRAWLPAERLQREFDAIGFFLTGHPLDDYAGVLKSLQVPVLGGVLARREGRRHRRQGRGHRGVARRAAHQDRQQDGHHRPVRPVRALRGDHLCRRPRPVPRSARTGQSGAAHGHRGGARRGGARAHPDASRRSIAPRRRFRRGLRIFLRDDLPLEAVAKRLDSSGHGAAATADAIARPVMEIGKPRAKSNGGGRPAGKVEAQRDPQGEGEVSLVVLLERGGEVEVRLPGRYKVSPASGRRHQGRPGRHRGACDLSGGESARSRSFRRDSAVARISAVAVRLRRGTMAARYPGSLSGGLRHPATRMSRRIVGRNENTIFGCAARPRCACWCRRRENDATLTLPTLNGKALHR